jgi:hypothetical protein
VLPVLGEGVEPPGPARVEATLEVEADAPRMLRRQRGRQVRETTDLLSTGDVPMNHGKTPVVPPPWFEHERATPATAVSRTTLPSGTWAARGLTEVAPAPRVSTQPMSSHRSLYFHTFVSIGAALMAAALTAHRLKAGDDASAAAVAPAATAVVAEAAPTWATEAEPEVGSTPAPQPALPSLLPPAEMPPTVSVEATQDPKVAAEEPAPIEPTAASRSPSAAATEPSARPKPPARPIPAPRVPVTVVLNFFDTETEKKAEIQIGNEITPIPRKTEIEVAAGTHRVRWRITGERDWRDSGRKRFRPGHGYFVRLREAGADIIDEGGKP